MDGWMNEWIESANDGAFKVQRKEEIKVKGEEQVQVWRAGLETESKTENRQPAIYDLALSSQRALARTGHGTGSKRASEI